MVNHFVIYLRRAALGIFAAAALAAILAVGAGEGSADARGMRSGPHGDFPGAPGGGLGNPLYGDAPGLSEERKSRDVFAGPDGRSGAVETVPKQFSGPAAGIKVSESFKEYSHSGLFGVSEYVVPRMLDGEFGVSFETGGAELPFSLTRANSETAEAAVAVGDGVLFADPAKHGGTYTQQLEGGGNMIVELLGSPAAPSVYEYAIDLPEGYTLAVNVAGGVDVLDGDGVPTGVSVAAPWAYDSAGAEVPVRYAVSEDGGTLEFEVDHLSGDFQYPIVADPCWDITRGNCGHKIAGSALAGTAAGALTGFGAPLGAVGGAVLCMIFCNP